MTASEDACACGCGERAGAIGFHGLPRIYALPACRRRVESHARTIRVAEAALAASEKICRAGCGAAVPPSESATQVRFYCSNTCRDREARRIARARRADAVAKAAASAGPLPRCGCGCGAKVPPNPFGRRRKYATPQCADRASWAARRARGEAVGSAREDWVDVQQPGRPSVEEVRARLFGAGGSLEKLRDERRRRA